MKKDYTCLLLWITLGYLCTTITGYASNPFKIKQYQTTSIQINQQISTTTTLTPFSNISTLYGLSVDATVAQYNDTSSVRIILEDVNGNGYLVLETSKMLNDTSLVVFSEYCEETNFLSGIQPASLRVVCKGATVYLTKLRLQTVQLPITPAPTIMELNSIREDQVQDKADRINAYNERHGALWYAGATKLARMSYSDRKRVLGKTDDSSAEDGFAYYVSGIYSPVPPRDFQQTYSDPRFVKEFRWTNRHGKNWMTGIKDQGSSSMCVFFATASVVEALVNLYFNNEKIDLSLSTPELSLYSRIDTLSSYYEAYYRMAKPFVPAPYVITHGVSQDYIYFYFKDDPYGYPTLPPYSSRTDSIKLTSWHSIVANPETNLYVPMSLFDSIKSTLIKYGPMVSGIHTHANNPNHNVIQHAMALLGFKTLQAGDTIKYAKRDSILTEFILSANSPYVGQTAWMFKDSYEYQNPHVLLPREYGWIVFGNDSTMSNPIYFKTPVINWTSDTIKCTDNDGDGYYFWGIGNNKPSCISWAPDEPDGDDSDFTKGPMDEYGVLRDNNPDSLDTIYIDSNTTFDGTDYFHKHMVVRNNATLNLFGIATFYPGVKITVEAGSTLWIGGTLDGASFDIKHGAKVKISQNAYTKLLQNGSFVIPLGAELEFIYGTIE